MLTAEIPDLLVGETSATRIASVTDCPYDPDLDNPVAYIGATLSRLNPLAASYRDAMAILRCTLGEPRAIGVGGRRDRPYAILD